jgi:hypothetical protein
MIEHLKVEEAAKKTERIRMIKELQAERDERKRKEIELHITFKQSRADERYEAHINEIRSRAKNENQKLNEVAFILEL